MLVLTRKQNERIIIGDGEIVITIVESRRDGKVRVGVDVPRDISVHRGEIFDAIKAEALAGRADPNGRTIEPVRRDRPEKGGCA